MLKLTLRNWCSHANVTLTFHDLTFVVGRNGCGKSSGVPEALEFVWLGTGKLRGAPTKKALADWSIRDDFPDCEVTAETCGVRYRRTMDREGSQEVYRSRWVTDGGGRWTEEEPAPLARDQGNPFGDAPDDLVRCMLEPTYFYGQLDPQRRQEVLVAATSDQNISREVALEALKKRLEPDSPDDVKAIEDAAHWIADEGFRGAEEAAIDKRVVAKRERKDVVVGELPEPLLPHRDDEEDGFIDLAVHQPQEHEEQLAQLRSDHTQAVRMEASGAGALGGKLAEAEEALLNLRRLEDPAMVRADEALGAAAARRSALETKGLPAELPAPAQPATAAQAIAGGAAGALASAEATQREAEEAIAALSRQQAQRTDIPRPDECPAGPPGMRCAAKPGQWNECLGKAVADPAVLEGKLDALRGELVEAKDRVTDAREANKRAQAELYAIKAAWEEHEASQAGRREAQAALETVRTAVETRTAEVASARADLEARVKAADQRVETARQALQAAQEGEQPSGPSVADLEASIALGERIVEASKAYWRERAAYEARRQKAEDLDATVSRWDAICQELKPDGIETTLGGGARDHFLELLGQASTLAGDIQVDDDCRLSVTVDREGYPKHPLQLSTSQQMAVGCALQHALCRQLDFPILVVDALDRFDTPHLEAWAAMAVEVGPDYAGGVIGLATIKSEPPNVPPQPWQTIWLKADGSAQLLEKF